MAHTVEPLILKSQDDTLGADFYRPARGRRPPVIIMAHGFAAERKFALPKFAAAFAEAGYAVVLFDYRGFGGSTGKPRELVSASHHVEDWKAVVNQIKKRKDVDVKKIVLWGTSFSGGHVLTTAARERGIKAVIAQVPHVDGLASSLLYPKHLLPQVSILAAKDFAGSKIGRDPVRIPVIASSGVRCLAESDCYDGYRSMIPEGSSWMGLVPARILLTITQYRPIKEVGKIKCPVLVIAAKNDSLIPIQAVRATVDKIKQVEFYEWPMGHFEPYQGKWFDENIKAQLAFLKTQLG
ncbi:MAG: alpha/beta hydrolase [Pseudomonadota bacterium]|nr:alpha/beta hydrolase [Pseudomonadota bacterium]